MFGKSAQKIVGLFSVLLVLAGCSSGPLFSHKKTLVWMGYAYEKYDDYRRQVSREFEKLHPGIKVVYLPVPASQYEAKLSAMIASGKAPDVFFIPYLRVRDFIKMGVLKDLTDFYLKNSDYFAEIHPRLVESQKIDGRYYTVPGNLNVRVLYFNREIFENAGYPFPNATWTWKDVEKAAKALTVRDETTGIAEVYGVVTGAYIYSILPFFFNAGARVWDEAGNFVLNSPQGRYALSWLKELMLKGYAPSFKEIRQEEEMQSFVMGRAAMYFGSTWEVAAFRIKAGDSLDFGATYFPPARKGLPRRTELQYIPYGIYAGTKHPDLAFEFVKFLSSPKVIKFFVEIGDSLPLRKSGEAYEAYMSDTKRPDDVKEVGLKSVAFAYLWDDVMAKKMSTQKFINIFDEIFEKFMIEPDFSAAQALSEMEERVSRELSQQI